MERRQRSDGGYGLYGGLPARRGNRLEPLERYPDTGINSRRILLDAVRTLLRADQADTLIARVPGEALLENGIDE